MTPEAFDAACRSLPGTTMDVLWEVDHVYKVGGKMFAVLGPGGYFSFKVNDLAFEMLVQTGVAQPAPYMARAKWVRVDDPEALSDEELGRYLREAHALIGARLTGKLRRQLGLA
jgi:predicted DNA-binding protein (MmcQ/YjbR family)